VAARLLDHGGLFCSGPSLVALDHLLARFWRNSPAPAGCPSVLHMRPINDLALVGGAQLCFRFGGQWPPAQFSGYLLSNLRWALSSAQFCRRALYALSASLGTLPFCRPLCNSFGRLFFAAPSGANAITNIARWVADPFAAVGMIYERAKRLAPKRSNPNSFNIESIRFRQIGSHLDPWHVAHSVHDVPNHGGFFRSVPFGEGHVPINSILATFANVERTTELIEQHVDIVVCAGVIGYWCVSHRSAPSLTWSGGRRPGRGGAFPQHIASSLLAQLARRQCQK
jgi:hypothetical protein